MIFSIISPFKKAGPADDRPFRLLLQYPHDWAASPGLGLAATPGAYDYLRDRMSYPQQLNSQGVVLIKEHSGLFRLSEQAFGDEGWWKRFYIGGANLRMLPLNCDLPPCRRSMPFEPRTIRS